MGRRHVRVLASLSHVYELVGIFDPDQLHAREVAAVYGTLSFCDEAACVHAAEIVVIASPIQAHARSARLALEQGRHVLVEKPMCASAEEAFALARAGARRGAFLYVGHSERFNPVVRALKRLTVADEVRAISTRRASPRPDRSEHGVLMSLGVHDLDLVAYLTGSPLVLCDASGVTRKDDGPRCGEARANLVVTTGSGCTARLSLDREAPVRERTIELSTSREVFEGDLLAPRLHRTPRSGGMRAEVELPSTEPLAEQALALAAALDGRRPARVATATEGACAISVALEAADWIQNGPPEAPGRVASEAGGPCYATRAPVAKLSLGSGS